MTLYALNGSKIRVVWVGITLFKIKKAVLKKLDCLFYVQCTILHLWISNYLEFNNAMFVKLNMILYALNGSKISVVFIRPPLKI
jgi:hypothetical protein